VQAACWSFNLYPEAGEGGGCLVRPSKPLPSGRAPNWERARQEAARRAQANRLATLTYAGEGCFDPLQLRGDVGEFFRGLRSGLGGEPFAYAWASEWHPGGHGLHVHFAVGRYVRERLIREVWGRGITHIKRIQDLPVGSGAVEEARRAAGYLAKYVSKSLDDDPTPGLHRYEVAQGFQPRVVPFRGESEAAVIAAASAQMGGEPAQVWRSASVEGWRAPPAYWCAWAG
jgi:hypothetical protein